MKTLTKKTTKEKKDLKITFQKIGQVADKEPGELYLGRCPSDARCKCRSRI